MKRVISLWSVAAMLWLACLSSAALAQTWYEQGERLLFDVSWGWITVGQAEILYEEEADQGYHITARAWADVPFFTMRDRIRVEGQHNPDKPFEPVRYTARQLENDYRADKIVLYQFDADPATASFENVHAGLKPVVFEVDALGRDFLSTLYYLRRTHKERLTVGQVIQLPVIGMHRIFTLHLHVAGVEHMRGVHGTQEVYRLEPVLHEIGGDNQVKSDWVLWATTDGHYLPLQIDIKLNFGKVRAKLVETAAADSPSKAPAGLPLVGDVKLPAPKPPAHAMPETW